MCIESWLSRMREHQGSIPTQLNMDINPIPLIYWGLSLSYYCGASGMACHTWNHWPEKQPTEYTLIGKTP